MDARTAIMQARNYVSQTYADERIFNVGLEEIEFDAARKSWLVTVGFSRPWDTHPTGLLGTGPEQPRRVYKVVSVRDSDGVISRMKNREPETA